MAKREQVAKPTAERKAEVVEETTTDSKAGEDLKAEIDALLDEIDEVLDTNAEEFVREYIQKGGE